MSRARVLRVGLLLLPLLLLVGLAVAGVVWADSSDGTTVDWSVLSSGGAPAAGGSVALNGTLGQTAIGPGASTHANLGAGFWYGLGEGGYRLYLPVVLRNF
jgi:hypothetical protein